MEIQETVSLPKEDRSEGVALDAASAKLLDVC